MDDSTRKEMQDIVDLVIRSRIEQLRELQIQDFADCMTVFLVNFTKILNAETDSRIKELIAQSVDEVKETASRHRVGFLP